MKIRIWGARGSIPVSGMEFLRYGGDTTCVEVRAASGDIIIIDAGSGIRALGKKLVASGAGTVNVLFTHSHWDHIIGFPFFRPLYRSGFHIDIFGCSFVRESLEEILNGAMRPPLFPVPLSDKAADITFHTACSASFSIGSLLVTPIILNHPGLGLGYRIQEDSLSFVFLTDNELGFHHPGSPDRKELIEKVKGTDLLIHDAEYDLKEYPHHRGWGHSTWQEALELALTAGAGELLLFHHDPDRTDAMIDNIISECREKTKAAGKGLSCLAAGTGMEISLE
jgi:phosphoribosyl 1,2-cyclic phosphodiesterase